MPFVDRGTHRLRFEARGRAAAAPVLLVMGLGLSSRAWGRLPELLAERFRVITFDNRGTGGSTRTDARFSMAELAEDAAAVLDAAGAPSAAVFGMSMGGMISIELALRYPERVRALALGCTFAGYLRSAKAGPSAMVDFVRVIASPKRGAGRATMARLLVSPEYYARDRAAFHDWLAHTEPAGIGTALRQVVAVLGHGTDARLHELRAPTLVLSGDSDRLVPAENSRRLARAIPRARLVELRGAGHCFALEREPEVTELLVEHFAAKPTPS